MKPHIQGDWRSASLDAADLRGAFDRILVGIDQLRIFERMPDGALAFVQHATEDLVHLTWEQANGYVCMCAPAARGPDRVCAAIALAALANLHFPPGGEQRKDGGGLT